MAIQIDLREEGTEMCGGKRYETCGALALVDGAIRDKAIKFTGPLQA